MIKKGSKFGALFLAIILTFSCLPATSAMAAHATETTTAATRAADQTDGQAGSEQALAGDGIAGVNAVSSKLQSVKRAVIFNEQAVTVVQTKDIKAPKKGQIITFTVLVENTGATDAENFIVTNHLGDGLTYVSSILEGTNLQGIRAGQNISWTVTIPANQAQGLLFTIKARAESAALMENVVTARSADETYEASSTQRFEVTALSYTVNYLETGTDKVLAPAKTVNDLSYGYVANEPAAAVDGYVADAATKSITLSDNEADNVINFYYTKRTDLSYTVRHLETGTDKVLHESETVQNQTFETVVQAADRVLAIPGYEYDADSVNPASITIGTDLSSNVLTLYYKKANFNYTVRYLEQGKMTVLHESKTGSAPYQSRLTASSEQIHITGFQYVAADTDFITIGVNPDNNVLTLYYVRGSFGYTVQCLDPESEEVLRTETGKALYQSEIKASDVQFDVEGYQYVSANTDAITIGESPNGNVLTLYYKKNNYPYTIQYLDDETGELLQVETGTAPYQSQLGGDDEQIPITGYDFSETPGLKIGTDPEKNVLTMYYTRASYAYTVLYLNKTTNTPIRLPKTSTAKYQSQVRAASERLSIEGYQYDSASAPGVIIETDTSKNVLTLYYTKTNGNTPPRSPYLNYTDHIAYIAGYPDGTFGPNQNITRNESAVIFYRLLTEAHKNQIASTTSPFPDVIRSSATEWYFTAVVSMANGQYIKGYPDGTFGGDRNITRAEFVTILMRFFPNASGTGTFPDVSADHFAYRYIAAASSYGWVTGYNDGTFRPNQNITRAEAVTILNRVLERGIDENSLRPDGVKNFSDNMNPGAWFYYEVIEAANAHEYEGARPSEDWTKLLNEN